MIIEYWYNLNHSDTRHKSIVLWQYNENKSENIEFCFEHHLFSVEILNWNESYITESQVGILLIYSTDVDT